VKNTIKKGIDPKFKSFVRERVQRYRKLLDTPNYFIAIHYMDEEKELDDPRDIVRADINVHRRYLRARLHIYPNMQRLWEKGERDEITSVIAHEIAHLATQHMFDVAVACYKDEGETKDAWETCTEIIGRLIHRLDEKGSS